MSLPQAPEIFALFRDKPCSLAILIDNWLKSFINEAKNSVVGRNLWIIHKNLPYADPETRQGGGVAYKGNSIGTLPTTRDIGVNVTLKF